MCLFTSTKPIHPSFDWINPSFILLYGLNITLSGSNGIIKHISPVKFDTSDKINRGEYKIRTNVRYDRTTY